MGGEIEHFFACKQREREMKNGNNNKQPMYGVRRFYLR
jgi:hypothetical protein